MPFRVEDLLIRPETTLREALAAMSRGARNILLLVERDGRLRRTVTDGDLRRLLLDGTPLEATLDDLPNRTPWTVADDTGPESVLALMNRHGIDQVPVLDDTERPVGVHLRRELDRPILLSTPHLSEHEREYVEQAFATNWIAPLGPNVDAFEQELADRVGVGHAAALSSGTAAIHLGLKLLGVEPGDTVFCSSLTFVATANPVRYLGAEPVFIDSEPTTWNMSPLALGRALEDADQRGRLPRAVVPVGLYGQSPDMEPIVALCERYGVPILEDAAESLGATYRGRDAGTFGRLGIYSFNGNKIITTSGGGMLVGDDAELIERARFLATQSREPAAHYQHTETGFNYRMSNILAGIGRGQPLVVLDLLTYEALHLGGLQPNLLAQRGARIVVARRLVKDLGEAVVANERLHPPLEVPLLLLEQLLLRVLDGTCRAHLGLRTDCRLGLAGHLEVLASVGLVSSGAWSTRTLTLSRRRPAAPRPRDASCWPT